VDGPDAQADASPNKEGTDDHLRPAIAPDLCGWHEPSKEKGEDDTRPETGDDDHTAPPICSR